MTVMPDDAARPRTRHHPARRARKVAAGISVATFAMLAGGLAVGAAVAKSDTPKPNAPATETTTSTTLATGGAFVPGGKPTFGGTNGSGDWGANPGSATPSGSNTQSNGS